MFKDYCENITEQEYRGSNRLSYSFIKDLPSKGPRILVEEQKPIFNTGTNLGSIVDKLLTEDGYDPLNEFTLTNLNPVINGSTHVDKLLKYAKENQLNLAEIDDLSDIYKNLGIKNPPKLTDEFYERLNLILNENKYLNENEYYIANTMAETLQTHEFTKEIFEPSFELEIINQAIIFFKIYKEECKCMLDKVKIDHKNKIIYPYDIKTGATFNFFQNFYNFKYYYQAGFYTTGIQSIVQTKEEFKDYTVAPFTFVYISREKPNFPIKYTMSDKYIEDVMTGFTNKAGYKIMGILDIIKDIKWYKANEEFEVNRELVENNGEILIETP